MVSVRQCGPRLPKKPQVRRQKRRDPDELRSTYQQSFWVSVRPQAMPAPLDPWHGYRLRVKAIEVIAPRGTGGASAYRVVDCEAGPGSSWRAAWAWGILP